MRRRLEIDIDLENDAFNSDEAFEVARILQELADRIKERGCYGSCIRDINGNTVGSIAKVKR